MKTESTVKPIHIAIRKIENGTAYIYHRTNITSEERTDEMAGKTTTMWVYDQEQYQVPVGNVTKDELLEHIKSDAAYRQLLAQKAEQMDADLGTSMAQVANWTKETEVPTLTYWARVAGFDASTEKPLEVTRHWAGHNITLWVYVTEDVKDAYVAGNLAVGDYVLVVFVDGDRDLPIAVNKVFKSW